MGRARKAPHRRRRLELRLVQGSIVDVDARGLVLGIFSNVDPSGAAAAIDERLDGAIREFTLRRMFSAQLGQVFVLPCARRRLRAEFVLFAGLGDFGCFTAEAQAFVAENVARTLARSHVPDLATVLLGAGSGIAAADAFEQQLRGLLDGLRQADTERVVRRMTFCEIDSRKFAAMVRAAPRLARRLARDDFEIAIETQRMSTTRREPQARSRIGTRTLDPAYLLVSMRESGRTDYECRSSLLTAGAKAAVLSGTVVFGKRDLQRLLAPLESATSLADDLPRIGDGLARLLIASSVREGLGTMTHRPLVVVHDRDASRVPWETLYVGGGHPALGRGISRRYESETLTVARWRDSRTSDAPLRVLLVANPTGDLPGAAAEARALRRIFGVAGSTLAVLEGASATRTNVLAQLADGRYDVLHFAGHAFFDADDPGRSGLLCADEVVLRGSDLANLANLPALVFCNACEAARVRRRTAATRSLQTRRSAGVAEAFLGGGVANFLGTHWPVSDHAALEFSTTVYQQSLDGATLGAAVLAARRQVHALGSLDWADYVLYGNPLFLMRFGGNRSDEYGVALRPKTAKLAGLQSAKRTP
ncbi:MAG TPA: CHAT domain-containing protein [Steroidobacteraceae bacterium]